MRYWLNSADRLNPEEFSRRSIRICDIYRNAMKLHEDGVHIVSTDEKTGIQALERAAPTLKMKPGQVERQEQDYIRHGTLVLIANFEVATGRILLPTIGKTRTEQDFVDHIAQTIASDPEGKWVFIGDQLNTHQSESLVKFVAQQCDIEDALGRKGYSGVLQSMKTRRAFLEDESHRIRFVFTPRHASWLNQVEIWFSILARRLLKRESFSSLTNLRDRIESFIAYFNETLAKPFKWTYKGKVLTV